jgi:hypothetical protein
MIQLVGFSRAKCIQFLGLLKRTTGRYAAPRAHRSLTALFTLNIIAFRRKNVKCEEKIRQKSRTGENPRNSKKTKNVCHTDRQRE